MINLKSLSEEALLSFFKDLGLPSFRSKQLCRWLYERNASHIQEITEFSTALREELSRKAYIGNLEIASSEVSADGTRRFLFALEDGETIESVLIPDGERLTLCVSSQVGCPMGCTFCVTGSIGLKRNLTAAEIVDQIISVNRSISPKRITNIVFMGMGEPLLNMEALEIALRIIMKHIKISRRRITVSTCGIVPGIGELGLIDPPVNLAVSLNAPDDRTRSLIMPVNRKYPLKSLLDACRNFPLPPRRRITFEYVLLKDINDSDSHAITMTRILKGIPCKINLIPFNMSASTSFGPPEDARVLAFQDILVEAGYTALIRKSKGADISAACGQLRALYRKSNGSQTIL